MNKHGEKHRAEEKDNTFDGAGTCQSLTIPDSSREWFQLKRAVEIIGIEMGNLEHQNKYKHTLVLIILSACSIR